MLDLVWVATFKDNPLPLFQYHCSLEDNKSAVEVPFSQVLEKQDELTHFALLNRRNGTWYQVDLQKGTIGIAQGMDNVQFLEPRADMLRKDELKYRLIYFREVTRNFDSRMQEVGEHSVNYFIGFQYTDTEGHNHKRLMCVNADGQVVIN